MPEYLYSPVGGTFNMCPYPWEKYCIGLNAPNAYCDAGGPTHTRIAMQSPMDVITGWEAPVRLYVSPGILSVAITHYGNACACFCGPTYAVSCHFYSGLNGGGQYIGSAFFAHIKNRHPQGYYNLSLQAEWPPYYRYLVNPLGVCDAPGGGGCSSAYHPHVEQEEASTGSEVQCPDTAVEGVTWLYRWG